MPDLILTGLAGDSPIGVMSALGLFRLLAATRERSSLRLAWSTHDPFRPILVSEEPLTIETLIARLTEHLDNSMTRFDSWVSRTKALSAKEFHSWAATGLATDAAWEFAVSSWVAAFGAEAAQSSEEKFVASPFDTSFAKQTFPGDFRQTIETLRANHELTVESLREAIVGPWHYKDGQHSMGWDPATVRVHAHSAEAPTKSKAQGVRGAVWLAFESLPLFPCFPTGYGVLPRAFSLRNREVEFCWPIWDVPVGLGGLKSLLGLKLVTSAKPDTQDMRARGIRAVFASRRARSSKYAVYFEPARLKAALVDRPAVAVNRQFTMAGG